jgi:hypothetical protein
MLLVQHHNVSWDSNDSQDKFYHCLGSPMTLVALQDMIGNATYSRVQLRLNGSKIGCGWHGDRMRLPSPLLTATLLRNRGTTLIGGRRYPNRVQSSLNNLDNVPLLLGDLVPAKHKTPSHQEPFSHRCSP